MGVLVRFQVDFRRNLDPDISSWWTVDHRNADEIKHGKRYIGFNVGSVLLKHHISSSHIEVAARHVGVRFR